MFALFIIAVIIAFIGVMTGIVLLCSKKKSIGTGFICAGLILAFGLTFFSCARTVPTGHTGIVTTFGNVEDYTFEAGFHFVAPWKSVTNMDNRNQKSTVDLACFSSDIQEVSVKYTLNYQIEKTNAQTIYKQIGTNYFTTVITPRIQESVKSVIAQYNAEELLNKRAELSQEIKSILTTKLAGYNIEVLDASLEDLDFSDAFTNAVEAKQVAEQQSKQAKIEQEQKIMEAEAAAKRSEIDATAAAAVAKIAAQADLDVVTIQANAAEYAGQKDAAIIGQVRDILAVDPEKLTNEDIENLLLYYYILQWNGELPQTYIGSEDFYALIASLGAASSAASGTGTGTSTAGN